MEYSNTDEIEIVLSDEQQTELDNISVSINSLREIGGCCLRCSGCPFANLCNQEPESCENYVNDCSGAYQDNNLNTQTINPDIIAFQTPNQHSEFLDINTENKEAIEIQPKPKIKNSIWDIKQIQPIKISSENNKQRVPIEIAPEKPTETNQRLNPKKTASKIEPALSCVKNETVPKQNVISLETANNNDSRIAPSDLPKTNDSQNKQEHYIEKSITISESIITINSEKSSETKINIYNESLNERICPKCDEIQLVKEIGEQITHSAEIFSTDAVLDSDIMDVQIVRSIKTPTLLKRCRICKTRQIKKRLITIITPLSLNKKNTVCRSYKTDSTLLIARVALLCASRQNIIDLCFIV